MRILVSGVLFLLLMSGITHGQSGGGFEITRFSIAGGGTSMSTDGGFTVNGVAGQRDAGATSNGTYTVSGGMIPSPIESGVVVPTMSEWATIVLAGLIVVVGAIVFRERRPC